MKEIPILYSTPMVQAILAGRKTETRRIVKQRIEYASSILGQTNPESFAMLDEFGNYIYDFDYVPMCPKCPYGKPGDFLWVRETWNKGYIWDGESSDPREEIPRPPQQYIYKTDDIDSIDDEGNGIKWKPSIHMPKSAARIWQEVIEVRVERLQDITEDGAIAEGIFLEAEEINGGILYLETARQAYKKLWESINGPGSWDANPWVWVIRTKIISTTGRP